MSGIIGYFTINNKKTSDTQKALHYWNKAYGESELHWELENKIMLGANLEHFSKKVPSLNEMLENEKYAAVIDALLYNRQELADKYGRRLLDLSDEELLFKLYTEHGIKAIADVNGDFSGAVYNKQTEELIIFRDHMGIRPVYYYYDDEKFIFSTDMRGILAVPGLTITIDEKHLFRMLTGTEGLCSTETDYEQIHYAKRACWFTVKQIDNKIVKSDNQEYWSLQRKKIRFKSENEYINEHRKRIEEAVKIRMDAIDGLIGAEISGGLDSSVLSILLGRLGREGRYFSWSYDPEDWPLQDGRDERKIIQDVCMQENITVKYRRRNNSIENHTTEQLMDLLPPPFFDAEPVSVASDWFHSEGVKAVLTGHGGDEGVSHRCDLYELWYHKEYLAYLHAIYRTRKGKKPIRCLRTSKEFVRRLIKVHPNVSKFDYPRYHLLDYLNPDYRKRMETVCNEDEFPFFYDVVKDFEMGGPRERMDNTAFQASKYGVRYLFPYLDFKLIEYCVSIPRYLFNNGRGNRWIYKQAFKDIMPPSLTRDHSKQTTSVPRNYADISDELIHYHEENAKGTIKYISRDFWHPYLDFDKLEHFVLPEKPTSQDINVYFFRYCTLTYCVLAENILKRAGEPVFKGDN